jgi:hypothetical protein
MQNEGVKWRSKSGSARSWLSQTSRKIDTGRQLRFRMRDATRCIHHSPYEYLGCVAAVGWLWREKHEAKGTRR